VQYITSIFEHIALCIGMIHCNHSACHALVCHTSDFIPLDCCYFVLYNVCCPKLLMRN